VRAEGLADAGANEADRAVPHDLLEGGGLLEGRLLQPQGEAMAVAAVDLVLEQELQELGVAQLPWRAWVTRSGSVGSRPLISSAD